MTIQGGGVNRKYPQCALLIKSRLVPENSEDRNYDCD